MLYDPGFENGSINASVWIGSKSTNYKNDQILVTPQAAHTGNYGIVGIKDGYSRAAQNVTYSGNGFKFSAWFYINVSEPINTSIWAGVLNIDAGTRANLDNTDFSRCVGYNNKSLVRMAQFQVGSATNAYRNFTQINTSGWYEEAITYDGSNMTFQLYDSNGTLLQSGTNREPGFVPKAVIVNAGSKSHYIDDLYYTTW